MTDQGSSTLTVRLLQTDPVLGDVDGNLGRLDALVRSGPGADLVVAPELATHGYHLSELSEIKPMRPDDPGLLGLGSHGPAVVAGFVEASQLQAFNSAAVLHDGVARVQRKLYLPNYRQWEERKHFLPGDRLVTHDLLGTRMSILICNDAWHPVMPWLAAHGGAEVLVVPVNSAVSNVGLPTSKVWDLLLQHAAVVLQSFVVFVNRSGTEAGQEFWGGSRVIHPSGEVLGQLGAEPGELDCVLDLGELRTLRRDWPLLGETRADLVAREALRLADKQG